MTVRTPPRDAVEEYHRTGECNVDVPDGVVHLFRVHPKFSGQTAGPCDVPVPDPSLCPICSPAVLDGMAYWEETP